MLSKDIKAIQKGTYFLFLYIYIYSIYTWKISRVAVTSCIHLENLPLQKLLPDVANSSHYTSERGKEDMKHDVTAVNSCCCCCCCGDQCR